MVSVFEDVKFALFSLCLFFGLDSSNGIACCPCRSASLDLYSSSSNSGI